ncbi:MAG: hypothetical protein FWH40_10155 [Coriobacteriia bacterium]|nr:hypothetical protein [Coriobacteriia bacterium]
MDRSSQTGLRASEKEVVITQELAAVSATPDGFINMRIPKDQFVESVRDFYNNLIGENAEALGLVDALGKEYGDLEVCCPSRALPCLRTLSCLSTLPCLTVGGLMCPPNIIPKCPKDAIPCVTDKVIPGWFNDLGYAINPGVLVDLVKKEIIGKEYFTPTELKIIESVKLD